VASSYGECDMTAISIQSNAMHLPLPDECVDLVVTSPPYFGLRSYTDDGRPVPDQVGGEPTPGEFIDALVTATVEMVRVLKPSGSIFVNLGDKYATPGSERSRNGEGSRQTTQGGGLTGAKSYIGDVRLRRPDFGAARPKSLLLLPERYRIAAVDRLGLIARAVIVWDKPNGLPESVCDRVRRSHEDWVHLTKQPRYFSAVDEIKEPTTPQVGLAGTFKRSKPSHTLVPGQSVTQHRMDRPDVSAYNPLGKLPGSVWRIPTAPLTLPAELGVDHFACVDSQTEILTRRGWLSNDQLRNDDEVAGSDLDSGMTRWTQLHGIHRYDYDGEMVSADARGLSMRLTPNHRTIVHRFAGRHRTRQPVEVVRADEMTRQHAIPRAVDWMDDGREKSIGVDLAALCGWVAAEGWVQGRRVRLSQSLTANPQHVATIDALLARFGSARRTERLRTYDNRPYTDIVWQLPTALAVEVLRLLPGKLLPASFGDLPTNEARALLDAFVAGDGHDRPDGRRAIFQKIRPNLDVLQAVAVRLGYNTTLSRDDGQNRWVLYLNSPRPARLRRSDGTSLVNREHYKGVVWCVTTGTGTFIARRRGTVFVTGNSFPPEWPKRIIQGWSPAGVCVECGEGRRPVAERTAMVVRPSARRRVALANGNASRTSTSGTMTRPPTAFISGYACGCADTTAPTTPGVVLDPFGGTGTTAMVAHALGRVGISVDLSHDYCRVAQWRTHDRAQIAKVRDEIFRKPVPQSENQTSLFTFAALTQGGK
jgi:DNA modification methylase